MNESLVNLVVWSLVIYVVFALLPYRRMPTCGMPLMYLFVLYLNHWFGAAIHCLPWYDSGFYEFVYLGFEQSFVGICGLIAGVGLGSFLAARFVGHLRSKSGQKTSRRVVEVYVITGLLFFMASPVLGRIPSIRTFVSAGWSLLIAGVCLGAWRSATQGRKHGVVGWLVLSGLFPMYTLIGEGFLSFGIAAVSVVFVFVAVFYRPRWQVVAVSVLSLYLGLSLFVTYMRDRSQIRSEVWSSDATIDDSAGSVVDMLKNFEWFDIHNRRHLDRVHERLNQNELVGRSVDLISRGTVRPANGQTLAMAAIAMVPRIIWRDKPVVAGSMDIVSDYTGLVFEETTSVGVGQVMEFYINFGSVGVLAGFVMFGALLRLFDVIAASYLRSGDWTRFILWFVPGMGLLQAGGSMVEVTSTVLSAIVFCVTINNYLLPWFVTLRIRGTGRRAIRSRSGGHA